MDDSSWQQVISSGLLFPPRLMTDSCRPRKLEPGLAQMYSKPRDLRTSSIKSEPERSTVSVSTLETGRGSVSFASTGVAAARRGSDCCATAAPWPATSAAVPPTALLKKLRRPTDVFLVFAITPPPEYRLDYIIARANSRISP